jgi:hypothetical protein
MLMPSVRIAIADRRLDITSGPHFRPAAIRLILQTARFNGFEPAAFPWNIQEFAAMPSDARRLRPSKVEAGAARG